MEYKKLPIITPRLIIHGGAGNILPSNLPPEKYKQYHDSLLTILAQTHYYLTSCSPSTSALDAACHAVTLLENNPLFNSGHGAVFTRDGINELEASVMVSKGKKKRGVGVMGLRRVKNPIKLAREMLLHGEKDLEGGNGEHRGPVAADSRERNTYGGGSKAMGAQGHSQLHTPSAEKLAEEWGLEMVCPEYFFVQARWDEHIKGLEREKKGGDPTWDRQDYVSQGTCGAVALDAEGVLCCATSTGGMTNKLTGRIGDTPTLGAGFWAEEWEEENPLKEESMLHQTGKAPLTLSETLKGLLANCFPTPTQYTPLPHTTTDIDINTLSQNDKTFRSTAMSGTGNGDSYLRLNAVRTASALTQFTSTPSQKTTLQSAITRIAGPGGQLVQSAGTRWGQTGEGEGGIIGIEFTHVVNAEGETRSSCSKVVFDFNCGGLFRAFVNESGKGVIGVWREGEEGLGVYEKLGEGREVDLREWVGEKVWV